MFTENLDVTSYEHGKRETHNPFGRAFAPVVWDYYQVRYGRLYSIPFLTSILHVFALF